MDVVGQPAHGDEVSNLTGTQDMPIAGPAAVTNPDDRNGSSNGGGGGQKPGEPATDPEEAFGGILPTPKPSTENTLYITDEAMDMQMTGAFE